MARQDFRHRSTEKSRDAECTYSSEIGKIKIDVRHVIRMPHERLPKKILYGELKWANAPMVVRKGDTITSSKPPLRTNIPIESWEQIAQDRAKWRGFIRRGAGEYEPNKISEAEHKHAQRKARA